MNKKKSMEIILSIGSVFVYLSGLAILFTKSIESDLYKFIFNAIIIMLLFLVSEFEEKSLEASSSSKFTFIVSLIGVITLYLFGGHIGLYGDWLTPTGDGSSIYYAIMALLAGLFSLLCRIRYKLYKFLYCTLLMTFMFVSCVLSQFKVDFEIIILANTIVAILMCLNNKNGFVHNFGIFATLLFQFISVVSYTGSECYDFLLVSISVIAMLAVSAKKPNIGVLAIILFFLNFIGMYANISENVNTGLIVVIASLIICYIDLANVKLDLLKNDGNKMTFKIISTFLLAIIIGENVNINASYAAGCLVASIFYIISSYVSAKIINNNSLCSRVEGYMLPYKSNFFILILYNFISMKFLELDFIYFLVASNLVMLLLYKYVKAKNETVSYLILLIISLLSITFVNIDRYYPVISLLFLLDYFGICINNDDKYSNGIYGVICGVITLLGVNATIFPSSLVFFTMLILFFLLSLSNKFRATYTIIPIVACFYSLLGNIDFIEITTALRIILSEILYMFIYLLYTFKVISEEKRSTAMLLFSIAGIIVMYYSFDRIVYLFAIVYSSILLIIGINKKYKDVYTLGLITIIIEVLYLLSKLDGIPTAVYLCIVGLSLIVGVSYLMYKLNKKGDLVEYHHNYCASCGNKLYKGEKFCSKCGTKIEKGD